MQLNKYVFSPIVISLLFRLYCQFVEYIVKSVESDRTVSVGIYWTERCLPGPKAHVDSPLSRLHVADKSQFIPRLHNETYTTSRSRAMIFVTARLVFNTNSLWLVFRLVCLKVGVMECSLYLCFISLVLCTTSLKSVNVESLQRELDTTCRSISTVCHEIEIVESWL